MSLPLLTLLAACNAILGYGDFVKIDGEPGGSGGDGGKLPTDPTTNPTTDPTTVPTTPPSGTMCKDATPWGAPVAVQGANTTLNEFIPSLSGDELAIVWQGPIGNGDQNPLMLAQRTAVGSPFGAATAATGLTAGRNSGASLSADGLTIFYHNLNGNRSLLIPYSARRASTTATAFTGAGPLANQGGNGLDTMNPHVSRDGLELFVLRATPPPDNSSPPGDRSIWHAMKSGNDFAAATAFAELGVGVTGDVSTVALSADRLTLYFSADRSGGVGGYDIWATSRATPTSPFGAPAQTSLAAVNTASAEDIGFVSTDNCRLYFSSNRGGASDDVFVSTRQP